MLDTVHQRLHTFAHRHDDLPAFHAGYLVLALLAAAMFSLGVFGLLLLTRVVLDSVKYREHLGYSWKLTLEGIVRENVVFLALFMVSLTFSVYLHHSIAFQGVSAVTRAELTIIRMFGTVLPTMAILHNFLKVITHLRDYLDRAHPRLRQHWSGVDCACFLAVALCVFLLLFAAPILRVEWSDIIGILSTEMIPWNL